MAAAARSKRAVALKCRVAATGVNDAYRMASPPLPTRDVTAFQSVQLNFKRSNKISMTRNEGVFELVSFDIEALNECLSNVCVVCNLICGKSGYRTGLGTVRIILVWSILFFE